MVVVVLVVVAAGYGYFRYQWGKVSSAACATCVAAANGAPYNVLLIGSDSRAGETAAEAQQFGNATNAGGQRSDTIKIVHVDPAAGTASTLSIPRDTYVTISGLPSDTQLSSREQDQRLVRRRARRAHPDHPEHLRHPHQPLHRDQLLRPAGRGQRPRRHLDGLPLPGAGPQPEHRASTSRASTCPTAGCQVLNGSEALALSRSRYFEYYKNGEWYQDGSSDIGRIERQNLIISAALDKAKGTYNPLRLNSLLTSVVHDFSKDNGLSPNDLFALAERYHAFSGSQLQSLTLPTAPAVTSGGSGTSRWSSPTRPPR